MPVVLTDSSNKVWAVEQPNDGLIHVGYTGEPGPRLLDVLDFVKTREKQFEKFVAKRNEKEMLKYEVIGETIGELRNASKRTRVSKARRDSGSTKKRDDS